MTRETFREGLHRALVALNAELKAATEPAAFLVLAKRAKAAQEAIASKLSAETDALRRELKDREAFWKPTLKAFAGLETEARAACARLVEEQRQRAREAELRAAREIAEAKAALSLPETKAEAGDKLIAAVAAMKEAVVAAVPAPVVAEGKSADLVRRWTFEIVKPEDVPREYCRPAPALIRDAVRAGRREIPGVRIFEAVGIRLSDAVSADEDMVEIA